MKTPSILKASNVVEFPVQKLVAPALFEVDFEIGDIVWFIHPKGAWIQGKVVSYFAHITPDKALEAFSVQGAKPANISNVGYAIEYFVPNPEREYDNGAPEYVKQVQLQDGDGIFKTKEDLISFLAKRNVIKYPEGV